ncbi:MAG: glycosyltransferase family 4 protein [Gemmatimonadales bacterium]
MVAHNHNRAEGTGGYTAELVARVALAHDVTLYAAGIASTPPANVNVVRVPALTGFAYGTILTFPLGFAIRRRQHDVVHAQGWVTGNADVVTAHVCVGAWREALRESGQAATGGERLFGGWVEQQEAELFRRARFVIAPSEKVRADLARCYGRKNDVVVIPHGFPQPRLLEDRHAARIALGLPRDAFIALYIGDWRKGLVNAIHAVHATPRVHLLVVGRRIPVAGRAEGRIHWRETTPGIESAYAAADVLLHPTIYDSFGLTVAEAMAYGVPVIVSAAAGVSELVDHGRSGWVVRGDVVAESAAALERFEGDHGLREVLAVTAREVAAQHSWDETVRRTLEVYERARSS